MSNSYFTLELDTTRPKIEVYAPSYVTRYSPVEVRVVANEKLDTYQETYVIDSLGKRHDLTFLFNETEFVGEISFDGYPFGITQLFVKVRDEVFNESDLMHFTFNLVSSEKFTITMTEKVRKVTTTEKTRKVILKESLV
jgi:hypothetical protein